jgi:DNA-directed RNA polymerase subunit RPC12/RpoP
MRSIRRRKQIRDLVRKAKERKNPPEAPPARPPAAAAVQEFFCRCGKILRVTPEDCNQTFVCPACARKMKVLRVGGAGLEVLRPVFHEEADAALLEGRLVPEPELAPDPVVQDDTASVTALVGTAEPSAAGPLDDAIEPEPPDQIFFFCPGCRAKLAATRPLYDRRARCSECSSRVLINLVFDRPSKMFDVRLVRLGDPPSGLTGIAPAVS